MVLLTLSIDLQADNRPSPPAQLVGFEFESLALDPGSKAQNPTFFLPEIGKLICPARAQSFCSVEVKATTSEKKQKKVRKGLFLSLCFILSG